MPTIAVDGDLFEQGYQRWINDNLPDYERIWATYVGNDGKSRPQPAVKIAEEAKDDWRKFYQAHYSMAVYAFLLDRHTSRAIVQLKTDEEHGRHGTPAAMTRNLENFTQFVALLGQVCDMTGQIASAVNDNAIAAAVTDLAAKRSNAIHAGCIPMSHDYLGVKIPAIALIRGAEGEWWEHARWDFVDRGKQQELVDWFHKTRTELLETLRNPVYPMIRKAAERRFVARAELDRGFKTPPRTPPPAAPPPARDPADPKAWPDHSRSGEYRPL